MGSLRDLSARRARLSPVLLNSAKRRKVKRVNSAQSSLRLGVFALKTPSKQNLDGEGLRQSTIKTIFTISKYIPGALPLIPPGAPRTTKRHRENPARRMSSANLGSSRRSSNTGSVFNPLIDGSLSSKHSSSHLNTSSFLLVGSLEQSSSRPSVAGR